MEIKSPKALQVQAIIDQWKFCGPVRFSWW